MAVTTRKTGSRPSKETPSAKEVIYLYGISTPAKRFFKLPGVDGIAEVEPLPIAGLACWISRVDAREFGEELAQRMESLDWLANCSVRHQRVVGKLAESTTILPARFGTVFRNEESLHAHVNERKPVLRTQLAHLQDAEEWGVKVFRRRQAAVQVQAATGSDYLREKSALLKRDGERKLDQEVIAFAKALQTIARDSAPAGKVSSGQPDLEWQASFLVPRKRRKNWHNTLQEFAARWGTEREIECTGPWPPYSFVS